MITARALLTRSAPLLACLGLLGVWQVAALILNNDSFPTALEAIRAIPSIVGDKESLINILASLRRMAIGFGLAVMVSIPLGLMMGRSRGVTSFFNPLLMVIYPVPKAALMPIIMLWLGVGDVAKTLVIFLGVSLPVIYHSFQGAKAVEEKMLWSGAAMGLSAAQRMIRIVLPAALIFAYSTLTKHALWIDRGFLGSAHILYLLAGVGLSAVGSRALRGIAAVTIGVTIATGEIDYYTKFEKSVAASAFHSLPAITPQHVVLVSPLWLDYEAYYYLRAETALWGVEENSPWRLVRLLRRTDETPGVTWTTCGEENLQTVSDIYAYGDASQIRTNRSHWPSCLLTKKIWVFEQSRWHPLDE